METLSNLFLTIIGYLEPLRDTWVWPGIKETGRFVGTHLISGMIPAFFIAGAISTFIDKQRVTKYMGAKANPLIAYPAAALSGGILTVCSCGVLPIFASILSQGAGIGPAFTFLLASPAVNLISLSYTYTLLGVNFVVWRIVLVFFIAIIAGFVMRLIFQKESTTLTNQMQMVHDDSEISDLQLIQFFALLVAIMITTTGLLDPIIRALLQIEENALMLLPRLKTTAIMIIMTAIFCYRNFDREEIVQWLKKSKSLFFLIFPKVLGGIFIAGSLAAIFPLTSYMSYFDANNFQSNGLASVIGSVMYFGTIVGVTIVSTLINFGMHQGPAMTLLISAPAISLPSVCALLPVAGPKKAAAFLTLVIILSAISGYLFGLTLE